MSDQQSDLINLGGLWLNESKSGTKYFSGYLGDAKILIFKNNHKDEGSKQPDYRMYLGKGKKQTEYEKGGSPESHHSSGGGSASDDTPF